jgi:anti-sigma regulatory factor (Ser/Thr protein kinase)/AraC-like DNA-binding protein
MDTINSEAVLRRLKRLYNIDTDIELAQFLGVSAPTVSNWKTRSSIDFSLVFSKCVGVNYHYILTGEGSPFAENDMGVKLSQQLNTSSELNPRKEQTGLENINQLNEIVSSLKDIFNDDMQTSIGRLMNQYRTASLPSAMKSMETEISSDSNIIDSLSSQLTQYLYTDEIALTPKEKEKLRASLVHNIHSTLSLTFGISTRVLTKPITVSFLMRRVRDILSPLVSETFLINMQMALEEILGPIIDTMTKAREVVDIYLQFTIDHEKLVISIQDFSEYNRIYTTDLNHSKVENSKERTLYHKGLELARQLMDDVFLTVEHGRCITIIAIKYFSISEDK